MNAVCPNPWAGEGGATRRVMPIQTYLLCFFIRARPSSLFRFHCHLSGGFHGNFFCNKVATEFQCYRRRRRGRGRNERRQRSRFFPRKPSPFQVYACARMGACIARAARGGRGRHKWTTSAACDRGANCGRSEIVTRIRQ